MLKLSNPTFYNPPELTPIVNAKPLHHLAVEVQFADGIEGRVVIDPSSLQGVFAPLTDPHYFQQVEVANDTITWPNGADLAPDVIYLNIAKNGVCVFKHRERSN